MLANMLIYYKLNNNSMFISCRLFNNCICVHRIFQYYDEIRKIFQMIIINMKICLKAFCLITVFHKIGINLIRNQ